MPLTLRRLLNYLPLLQSRGNQYVRASWHKPTLYDEWRSQAPFRARPALRTDHFRRSLQRRRLIRGLIRWAIVFAVAWVVWESVRAVTLL